MHCSGEPELAQVPLLFTHGLSITLTVLVGLWLVFWLVFETVYIGEVWSILSVSSIEACCLTFGNQYEFFLCFSGQGLVANKQKHGTHWRVAIAVLIQYNYSLSLFWSGLRIIFTLDEVAFIQNLVFYIEAAYKVAVSSYFICKWSEHCSSVGGKLFIAGEVK